jgi:flavin-dependent dehydrogenase
MFHPTEPTIGCRRSYDAIVVGARPAGASTAMLLARAGRRVLLVDRSAYGTDTRSTHALMRAGVMQLQRWGLLDAVRRANTPAIKRTVFHYGDDRVNIAIREQHGVDALYAPRRTVLDRVVVDAAIDAGVETVFGVHVRGIERDANGRVCGIRAQTAAARNAIATAPIVIGADGAHSTIAQAVGAVTEYETTPASAIIYGYFAGLDSDQFDLYYEPGVTAGVIPTNDGQANVYVSLSAARFASERYRDIKSVFDSILLEAAPEVAGVVATRDTDARFRTFPGLRSRLLRAHGPGWALVGDAGYFKDPLTAHGITDALRDAELLVRALLETPVAEPDAAPYQTIRDALAIPFMNATAAAASYTWTLAGLQAIHLDLARATEPEVELLAELGDPNTVAALSS